MDTMGDEMAITNDSIVGQEAFWVEDEAMKEVFDESEEEKT